MGGSTPAKDFDILAVKLTCVVHPLLDDHYLPVLIGEPDFLGNWNLGGGATFKKVPNKVCRWVVALCLPASHPPFEYKIAMRPASPGGGRPELRELGAPRLLQNDMKKVRDPVYFELEVGHRYLELECQFTFQRQQVNPAKMGQALYGAQSTPSGPPSTNAESLSSMATPHSSLPAPGTTRGLRAPSSTDMPPARVVGGAGAGGQGLRRNTAGGARNGGRGDSGGGGSSGESPRSSRQGARGAGRASRPSGSGSYRDGAGGREAPRDHRGHGGGSDGSPRASWEERERRGGGNGFNDRQSRDAWRDGEAEESRRNRGGGGSSSARGRGGREPSHSEDSSGEGGGGGRGGGRGRYDEDEDDATRFDNGGGGGAESPRYSGWDGGGSRSGAARRGGGGASSSRTGGGGDRGRGRGGGRDEQLASLIDRIDSATEAEDDHSYSRGGGSREDSYRSSSPRGGSDRAGGGGRGGGGRDRDRERERERGRRRGGGGRGSDRYSDREGSQAWEDGSGGGAGGGGGARGGGVRLTRKESGLSNGTFSSGSGRGGGGGGAPGRGGAASSGGALGSAPRSRRRTGSAESMSAFSHENESIEGGEEGTSSHRTPPTGQAFAPPRSKQEAILQDDIRNELNDTFRIYADGRGSIGRAEFSMVLADLGILDGIRVEPAGRRIEKEFKLSDKNHDGSIDLAEFQNRHRDFVEAKEKNFFASFHSKVAPPGSHYPNHVLLQALFRQYCMLYPDRPKSKAHQKVRGRQAADRLSMPGWIALIQATSPPLTDADFTVVGGECCFSKAKERGERCLEYPQFLDALALVAGEKAEAFDGVADRLLRMYEERYGGTGTLRDKGGLGHEGEERAAASSRSGGGKGLKKMFSTKFKQLKQKSFGGDAGLGADD